MVWVGFTFRSMTVSISGPGEPITLDIAQPLAPTRTPTTRRYLMCPPTYFTVEYAINPWMDPTQPTSTSLAVEQWTQLKETYERLGHEVNVIEPVSGLPDMVAEAAPIRCRTFQVEQGHTASLHLEHDLLRHVVRRMGIGR